MLDQQHDDALGVVLRVCPRSSALTLPVEQRLRVARHLGEIGVRRRRRVHRPRAGSRPDLPDSARRSASLRCTIAEPLRRVERSASVPKSSSDPLISGSKTRTHSAERSARDVRRRSVPVATHAASAFSRGAPNAERVRRTGSPSATTLLGRVPGDLEDTGRAAATDRRAAASSAARSSTAAAPSTSAGAVGVGGAVTSVRDGRGGPSSPPARSRERRHSLDDRRRGCGERDHERGRRGRGERARRTRPRRSTLGFACRAGASGSHARRRTVLQGTRASCVIRQLDVRAELTHAIQGVPSASPPSVLGADRTESVLEGSSLRRTRLQPGAHRTRPGSPGPTAICSYVRSPHAYSSSVSRSRAARSAMLGARATERRCGIRPRSGSLVDRSVRRCLGAARRSLECPPLRRLLAAMFADQAGGDAEEPGPGRVPRRGRSPARRRKATRKVSLRMSCAASGPDPARGERADHLARVSRTVRRRQTGSRSTAG